jgi:hypothetical protein
MTLSVANAGSAAALRRGEEEARTGGRIADAFHVTAAEPGLAFGSGVAKTLTSRDSQGNRGLALRASTTRGAGEDAADLIERDALLAATTDAAALLLAPLAATVALLVLRGQCIEAARQPEHREEYADSLPPRSTDEDRA